MIILKRLILSLCILFPITLTGQKIKKVHGEYTFYAPNTISIEQAQSVALERAKIQILADTYGTIVDATSLSVINNENGDSDIDYQSFNETSVKGEWVETIGKPEYSISYENNQLIVNVKVYGKVRELVVSKISVEAKVLRNGLDDKFEQYDFVAGDDMYISFKSPSNGFLTIYMYDGTNTVYRLLPYKMQSESAIMITDGRKYVFFSSKETSGISPELIDEYELTCSKDMEINKIYIIFSPNKFVKANDDYSNNITLPKELDYKDFRKWLSKCMAADSELVLTTKNISIKNK